MRIPLVATGAFLVALAAFATAAFTVAGSSTEEVSTLTVGTVGIAIAAILVSIATFYIQNKPPAEVSRIPLENFTLWADVGEPAAGIRRIGEGDVNSAMKIASTDFGSLASNSWLLSERLSILMGKHGFDELTRGKLNRGAYSLTEDIRSCMKKLRSSEGRSTEGVRKLLDNIEGCASQADRIANKLYDFERGKPEIIKVQTEPLRRAAEKLSRDLRQGNTNLRNFLKLTSVAPTPVTPTAPAAENVPMDQPATTEQPAAEQPAAEQPATGESAPTSPAPQQ
jgi:hypothetical protein